ncbi:MAG: sigma-70 family RNA polymerase sigma factor [Verrucomicrobiales bacterium]|nr:sigma-70 family RNA polymerase sigma factor [Verrucomicrobiales bacterium]
MEKGTDGIESDQAEDFIRLLAEHEQRLGRYVLMLVPNVEDSNDILQESKLVMWRSFDQFQPGTNFSAWARKVIFNQVLKYRRQPARRSMPFSEDTLMLLEENIEQEIDYFDKRHEMLSGCVNRLKSQHRSIVDLRYNDGLGIESIAQIIGRTSGAVYRVLSRIRKNLRECVSRKLQEEMPGEN